MLKDNLLENTSFLNSYLTEKDFSFISSLDKNIQEIDSQLHNLQIMRDTIVSFINALSDNSEDLDSDNYKKLIVDTETAFNYVNTNIKSLISFENEIQKMNSDIINLLIDISSKKLSEDEAENKTKELQDNISAYAKSTNSINDDILKGNVFLNNFFNADLTKKYLNNFSISTVSFNLPEKKSSILLQETTFPSVSLQDNNVLTISEKKNKVFLPYKKEEIEDYLEQYPDKYKSYKDVINNEFIIPLNYYQRFPVVARFREAYSLVRDKEGKPVIEAIKYAMSLMLKSELNPAIIAACKYQEQLDNYIDLLADNNLDKFTDFEIKFEVSLDKKRV